MKSSHPLPIHLFLFGIILFGHLLQSRGAAEEPLFSFSDGRPTAIGLQIFQEGDQTSLRITTKGAKEPQVEIFALDNPPRLVVDLRGIRSALRNVVAPGNSRLVSAIRFGSHPDRLRIVFDFKNGAVPHFAWQQKERAVTIDLKRAEDGAKAAPAEAPASIETPTPIAIKQPAKVPSTAVPAVSPSLTLTVFVEKAKTAMHTAAVPFSPGAVQVAETAAAGAGSPIAISTSAPSYTPTLAETKVPTSMQAPTKTATPTKTAAPTRTPKPTRTPTPSLTPRLSKTATPTVPLEPAKTLSPTQTLPPQSTAAAPSLALTAIPGAEEPQALKTISFQTSSADAAPLILLELNQRPSFRLSKKR